MKVLRVGRRQTPDGSLRRTSPRRQGGGATLVPAVGRYGDSVAVARGEAFEDAVSGP